MVDMFYRKKFFKICWILEVNKVIIFVVKCKRNFMVLKICIKCIKKLG